MTKNQKPPITPDNFESDMPRCLSCGEITGFLTYRDGKIYTSFVHCESCDSNGASAMDTDKDQAEDRALVMYMRTRKIIDDLIKACNTLLEWRKAGCQMKDINHIDPATDGFTLAADAVRNSIYRLERRPKR